MDHQLHAAALVEEPFGDHLSLGGDHSQDPFALLQVGDQLPAGLLVNTRLGHDPLTGRRIVVQTLVDAFPKIGDLLGQFPGAAGRLSQPEGDRRWLTLGVLHPDLASFDPANLPRGVSQQEHVAGQTLNGEVLVDGADKRFFRIKDDVVIGIVWDGPAAGHGRYGRAPPALNLQVDAVTVEIGAAPALAEGEPLRQDCHYLVELLPGQFTVGVGLPAEVEQVFFGPLFLGAGGDDLLGENVQRPGGNG